MKNRGWRPPPKGAQMSDLDFWYSVRREVEPWFDGHDMERV
jgi:hypothetical protein